MKKYFIISLCFLYFGNLFSQSLTEKADDGDPQSQYELALMYLKGQTVIKDSLIAADLLLSSAGGGWCSPSLIFQSPVNYDKSATYKPAESKLLELCTISSNSNYIHYFLALSGFLFFAKEDYPKAEKYFKTAIKNGSCLAEAGLGLMYFYVAANSPQWFPWYDSDLDYFENRNVLGLENYKFSDNTASLYYLQNKKWDEKDNVAYWLEQAIKCGDFGTFQFGLMGYNLYDHLLFVYMDGVGNQKNFQKAIKVAQLYLKDNNVDSEGWYFAGRTFDIVRETVGVNQDLFDVFNDLYTFSKDKKNTRYFTIRSIAASGLGEWYYKGYGSQKPNYNTAFDFLSEAAILGDCSAMRLLAACYRYGRGVDQNDQKDKEWIKKAKDCGDHKAKEIEERRNR